MEFTPFAFLRKNGERKEKPQAEAAPIKIPELKTPPVFLGWQESLEKFDYLLKKPPAKEGASSVSITTPELLAFYAFRVALEAEREAVKLLNDEYLNCMVPWDPDTGFPTPSTIAGDAASLANTLPPHDTLRAILESFSRWTVLAQERILCSCGKSGSQQRDVELKVLMNHSIKSERGGLTVKQFVGVRSGDFGHLKHHYGFKKDSKASDDIIIVWICENRVSNTPSGISVEPMSLTRTGEINGEELGRRLREAEYSLKQKSEEIA